MDKIKIYIKYLGGIVAIFAAVFGVLDFNLGEPLTTYITYAAYILLFLFGGNQALQARAALNAFRR